MQRVPHLSDRTGTAAIHLRAASEALPQTAHPLPSHALQEIKPPKVVVDYLHTQQSQVWSSLPAVEKEREHMLY